MLAFLTDMVSNHLLLLYCRSQVRLSLNSFLGNASGGYATSEWLASKLLTYLEREWDGGAAPEMAVAEAFLQADAKVLYPWVLTRAHQERRVATSSALRDVGSTCEGRLTLLQQHGNAVPALSSSLTQFAPDLYEFKRNVCAGACAEGRHVRRHGRARPWRLQVRSDGSHRAAARGANGLMRSDAHDAHER